MDVSVKQHSELTRWVQVVDSVEGASHCWVVFAGGTRKEKNYLEIELLRLFKSAGLVMVICSRSLSSSIL